MPKHPSSGIFGAEYESTSPRPAVVLPRRPRRGPVQQLDPRYRGGDKCQSQSPFPFPATRHP